jgi:hypothetical protein
MRSMALLAVLVRARMRAFVCMYVRVNACAYAIMCVCVLYYVRAAQ